LGIKNELVFSFHPHNKEVEKMSDLELFPQTEDSVEAGRRLRELARILHAEITVPPHDQLGEVDIRAPCGCVGHVDVDDHAGVDYVTTTFCPCSREHAELARQHLGHRAEIFEPR
jgi:hypothetical protein